MKSKQVRNWLGIYFLTITGVFGAYLLLFRETSFLPISNMEAVDAFEILIPVLLAQIAMIFRWFSETERAEDVPVEIPHWVVVLPPVIVTAILILAISMLIVGNSDGGHRWAPSPEAFKAIVTFCVSILNASTLFIVSKYFQAKKPQS